MYYCRNGRDGLAYGALKLSALRLSPMDYFGNYIFEISRQNCIICTINSASTLTFIKILFPAWCGAICGLHLFSGEFLPSATIGSVKTSKMGSALTTQWNFLVHFQDPVELSFWTFKKYAIKSFYASFLTKKRKFQQN